MPTIRQLVDEARESYRVTLNGRVTDTEALADRDYEREMEQDTRDRHGPASWEDWRDKVDWDRKAQYENPDPVLPADHPGWHEKACGCGCKVRVDIPECPLCGAVQ